jgi:serine/threonine protein kinase
MRDESLTAWIDDKLMLLGPLDGTAGKVLHGRLRGPDGACQEVIVKVLDVRGLRDWADHDRFTAQRLLLESLTDLPVPRALGDFEHDGCIFHCQSVLTGAPIGTTRTVLELEALARELLGVLARLHARGVVHGDLAPRHVLVDGSRVQLLDFSSARRCSDAQAEPIVVGTPGFMAPEQRLGTTRIESDLYAAGKTLEAGLAGRRPTRRLARLLAKLAHADWRRRPRSATAALRILDRSPARHAWMLAPAVLAASFALTDRHQPAAPPPVDTPLEPAMSLPVPDTLEADARALLAAWERAQNKRDFVAYSLLYGDDFIGRKRTPRGQGKPLDRPSWLDDRSKMFRSSLEVAADAIAVTTDPASGRATLDFVQHFRAGEYTDHGRKRIIVARTLAGLRIVSEEMLDARPGWDEDDFRRRFPAHGATCEVAFDPSNRAFLVGLARSEDYVDALRTAGKARSRGIPVEIVWSEDFERLPAGYWVLSGATDDISEARAIAAHTHGRVLSVRPGHPQFPSVLRFLEERSVQSDKALITVVGDTAYVVNKDRAIAMTLVGDQLVEKFRVEMPVFPVRVGVREGHAFVLDTEGHWSILAESGVVRTRSFDPEPEGRLAVFGDRRFEIETDALAYRYKEGEPHRFPLLSEAAGVWRIGTDRLLLYHPAVFGTANLFLFAVGDTPLRLTKVCGTITGPLAEPAHVTAGGIDLDTDEEGGFELWSAQWGFFAPSLNAFADCETTPPNERYLDSHSHIDNELNLFRRPLAQVDGSVECTWCGD